MILSKPIEFKAHTMQTFVFHLEDHLEVKEATLSFQVYGCYGLQALQFIFRDPKNKAFIEATAEHDLLPKKSHLKLNQKILMLRFEYILRKLIQKKIYYRVEVPVACFLEKQLLVEITNIGVTPLLFGTLSLNSNNSYPY